MAERCGAARLIEKSNSFVGRKYLPVACSFTFGQGLAARTVHVARFGNHPIQLKGWIKQFPPGMHQSRTNGFSNKRLPGQSRIRAQWLARLKCFARADVLENLLGSEHFIHCSLRWTHSRKILPFCMRTWPWTLIISFPIES